MPLEQQTILQTPIPSVEVTSTLITNLPDSFTNLDLANIYYNFFFKWQTEKDKKQICVLFQLLKLRKIRETNW